MRIEDRYVALYLRLGLGGQEVSRDEPSLPDMGNPEHVAAALSAERVFSTDQREFEARSSPTPCSATGTRPELRDAFVNHPKSSKGTQGARSKQGLATADDVRFLRLRWEVDPSQIGALGWQPFAKGGEYSPFYDDIYSGKDAGKTAQLLLLALLTRCVPRAYLHP